MEASSITAHGESTRTSLGTSGAVRTMPSGVMAPFRPVTAGDRANENYAAPMDVVTLVLVAAGLVTLAFAVLSLRRLKAEVAELDERTTAFAAQLDALPPELNRTFGTGARHIIAVELLNLFELAHRESALTRPFTVLTPRLLRDVVHRSLVGKVRRSLADSGVETDVRLHRAR